MRRLALLLLLSLGACGCASSSPPPGPSASASAAPTPAPGPLIDLPLDGDLVNGGTLKASVRAVGGVSFQPGRRGKAALVSAPGSFVEVDPGNRLDLSAGATLELWFQPAPRATPQSAAGKAETLVALEPLGLSVGDMAQLIGYERSADNKTTGLNSDIRLATPGRWHHAAIVSDPRGRRTITLYLDGRRQQENANISSPPDGTLTLPMRIGASDANRGQFRGRIDDVRLYEYPRSEAEIRSDAD
jgi:hypothetical protein